MSSRDSSARFSGPSLEPIPTKFFEDWPLYSPMDYPQPGEMKAEQAIPAIRMECLTCKSDQTFVVKSSGFYDVGGRNLYGARPATNPSIADRTLWVTFCCAACDGYKLIYFVHFSIAGTAIQKVGQLPGPSIRIPKQIERLLGDDRDYYKKGRICENHGYGVAAFAYYRRIVETMIDELLNRLRDILPEEKKAEFSAALDKAKGSRVAQEKIDLVKDLLPDSLRPDGMNPLGILHSALSEGLHSLDDEECLHDAMSIRTVLDYLVQEIAATETRQREFTGGMRKLLEKKSTPKQEN
jgi:hypothetical protein